MTFKMEGKEIYHIFVFTKYCCVSSIRKVPQACAQEGFASMRTARFRKHAHSKVPQACAQQTEKSHSHTNYAVSRCLCACPVSSASMECIFQHMRWYDPSSGKTLDADKADEFVKKYRFYRAEEDNQ